MLTSAHHSHDERPDSVQLSPSPWHPDRPRLRRSDTYHSLQPGTLGRPCNTRHPGRLRRQAARRPGRLRRLPTACLCRPSTRLPAMTTAPGSGDALQPGAPVAGLLRCTPATPGATTTTIVSALFRSACPAGDPRLAPSSPSASNDVRPALGVSGDLHHPVPDSPRPIPVARLSKYLHYPDYPTCHHSQQQTCPDVR